LFSSSARSAGAVCRCPDLPQAWHPTALADAVVSGGKETLYEPGEKACRLAGRRVGQGDICFVQGVSPVDRELWDAEWVCGHLARAGSVFAFLADHRRELFPEAMFAYMFRAAGGRPSVPPM
jgi:hypothetical protein